MEIRQVLRELKKPEVQQTFKTIIVDTIDLAADFCQKYICDQLGIESIGEGGWTNNGWSRYKKEFEDVFRTITQLGYAVIFISHAKETTNKRKDGTEYTQIKPSLQSSASAIVENMSDIIGYAHQDKINGENKVVLTLRDPNDEITCGGRFKYIEPVIEFNYNSLVKALNDAIDREEEAVNNPTLFTDEKEQVVTLKTYDYEALIQEFNTKVKSLMDKDSKYYGPRITAIVNKYLGKGKKVSEATIEQAEFIYLINTELDDELINKGKD